MGLACAICVLPMASVCRLRFISVLPMPMARTLGSPPPGLSGTESTTSPFPYRGARALSDITC
eukprot:9642047-Heterocapsa_arctica.AAC.1